MGSYNIIGLSEIKPPAPTAEDPGDMTDAEVSDHVRFWNRPQLDPNSNEVRPGLLGVQAAAQLEATQGRNPQNSGVEDCKIAAISDGPKRPGPQGFVQDGVGVLYVSKDTGKSHYGDLIAPSGANQETYNRINAQTIVRICRK